jgi:hypothetical protein
MSEEDEGIPLEIPGNEPIPVREPERVNPETVPEREPVPAGPEKALG